MCLDRWDALNYIRLWHDNTGEGSSASWFLKYIIVRDLQTSGEILFHLSTMVSSGKR